MSGPDRVLHPHEIDDDRRRAWSALVAGRGSGYFTGPTWVLAWYEAFAGAAPARIGWWGPADAPDAVAALVQVREPLLPGVRRGPSLRTWQNLGAGPGGADHLGFPAARRREPDVVRWVLDHPGSLRLGNLSPDRARALGASARVVTSTTRTYAVELTGRPRPGSKKLWKHIVRSRRQLVERGVDFDLCDGRRVDPGLLDELFALHGLRSDRAGRTTTFTGERRAFHANLAASGTDELGSFVVTARLEGRLVGALYGFRDPSRWSYYQSGWDPTYERASLGSVLIGEAIDRAVAHGATVFDFLRGDEPYKLRFGASVHEDVSLLVPRGPMGQLLVARDRLVQQRDRLVQRRGAEGTSDVSGRTGEGPAASAGANSGTE